MFALSLTKKKEIDENELAVWIARCEGGEKEQNIAQIKEVLKLILDALGQEFRRNPRGVFALLRKHGKKPVIR